MNAERLHALIGKIGDELQSTQAIENLAKLGTALGKIVQESNAQTQQQLSNALQAFRSGLLASNLNGWSPAWVDLLKEVHADSLLGAKLLEHVNTIITSNAITPAVAKQEVDEILESATALRDAVAGMETGFEVFEIGSDPLEGGECEVGFLIPRPAVGNELGGLAAELKELDFILRTICEVATGQVEPAKIRTLSSSNFLILLAQHSGEAALFATVMERLIAAYQKILEIRKLHSELSALVGEKPLAEVVASAERRMEEEIERVKRDAIAKSPVKDAGRKNELSNALDSVLRKLADRIDRGFNIEIRIEPLENADSGEKPVDAQRVKVYEEHRHAIEQAAKQLEFSNRGGSPILHLDRPNKEPREKSPKKGAAPNT